MEEIERYSGTYVNKIIVGNKSDLEEKRVIDPAMAEDYAKELGLTHIEASAKSSKNISDAFQQLAEEIKQRVGPPAGCTDSIMDEFQIELTEPAQRNRNKRCC